MNSEWITYRIWIISLKHIYVTIMISIMDDLCKVLPHRKRTLDDLTTAQVSFLNVYLK